MDRLSEMFLPMWRYMIRCLCKIFYADSASKLNSNKNNIIENDFLYLFKL